MTVYLDHAATTPLRSEARDAWLAAIDTVGNPSSIHRSGQAARRLLEDARERLAAVLGCDAIEVVFTSGGTEAINLAVKGLWFSRAAERNVVVLPDGEHHATLDAVEWLRTGEGATVRPVALDRVARIPVDTFAKALAADVAVATAMVANNEAGTINDAVALAAAATDAGVPLHLDAVASFGHCDLPFSSLARSAAGGAHLMSISAHKIGGPPSIGALVVSRKATITALHHGGSAQRGLRAGTPDAPSAAAFAAAAEATFDERVKEDFRLRELRDALISGIGSVVPESELLGDPDDRLPGNAHFLFPGAAGESMLYLLDAADIAVSTGSACQAGIAEPSHVVQAMGRTEAEARSVLRMTVGRTTTPADVDAVIAAVGDAYRRASGRR
ncbi:cysteine desulfurase family protein [Microbacterium sp. NC79]|uniref:cysteine desulfurase family protein n=1 Tax=Microbacterium sp. NC79 TaxID=2851009 RepID=UPI001C2BC3DC|nr:cysteine desulfurase family protein [Microbacterium sp. NC79]MBV0894709.1 cysteine desulfurase [Microbacterium sp. NC79]